uniref:Uncharacterized protein n=1 Tax=Ditylenchus dipsaci TaxID=166011 RepID=A0A915ES15_9BILA
MEALKILPMLHGNMTGPSGFDVNSAFYTSLLANPLLFGSLGITLFGFIGYYFRRAYSIANKLFWQRITKTLSVSSNNM